MKDISMRRWVKFAIIIVLYILWTVWIENYWWLLLVPIIFDHYITQFVNWTFWKKRGVKKHTKGAEWADAIIFATIAASFIRIFFIEAYTIPTSSMEGSLLVGDYLFVSKTAYGPKLPNTPISFPFVHNTLPFTTFTPSYSRLIEHPYKRIAGLTTVKNDDVVVFNFPAGDTVALKQQNPPYEDWVRDYSRKEVWDHPEFFGKVIYRPVDRRESYIKRCVAIAGDTLTISQGQVYIDGKPEKEIPHMQLDYKIHTKSGSLSTRALDRIGIPLADRTIVGPSTYSMPLDKHELAELGKFKSIESMEPDIMPKGFHEDVFPFVKTLNWNRDNYGPLWIPKAGATIDLNVNNLPFYARIIKNYEGHDLRVEGNDIYIDGKISTSYTFGMNYYWMMGDNRHKSLDSRYWGFVPEDHIVGKAKFVWMSVNPDGSGFGKIRWSRLLSFIH